MSYQALYRAWRPDTFTEIVGQDAVTRTLKRQVTTGRIAHAYLFCGTRGTGKTSAAKVLARAINCLNPRDGDPCGECEICRTLRQENSMDVVEIDAASNNGVDEIRDLREKVKYPPALTKYKVYIIDEVHMLSTGAFNALLKTLEEPPKHVVFILATTEPQRLPATILSRCQRFDFHRISMEVIIERLMVVLGGIGRSASEEALNEIARAAEGAMRDALSLLDVCLSYTDGEVTGQLARDVLGTAGRAAMFDFADALIEGDAGGALMQIDAAMRRGSDPQVFMRDTVAHLRGVMLAGAVPDGVAELMEITPEDAARFAEQAARTSPDALERILELFMRAEPDAKWASRPRASPDRRCRRTARACTDSSGSAGSAHSPPPSSHRT
ncbi:MAG: DNA polymerase III subunit gamma/tau [Clostridia bacterium]|nr:DNA polymerase III subunit gamma/tau [Clostridia bacterium]